MPLLNKTRVVGARFNNGKQYFDDLRFDSQGGMVVVDMVNGGGKSFYIQCIGQTIIPNSLWQKDWEFKEVFDVKNKNTVIHCQTEWVLDSNGEDNVGYKYLLAGFCAIKPTTALDEDGEVTYGRYGRFSYICLYNNPNENDIFRMPLKEGDKLMSFNELKQHLHKIKGPGYYTEVFDSAREYRKRLAQYNITSAEWELIRGVNEDEKFVATYLRRYDTSEKLILNFLLPKIEECNANRLDVEYQDSEKMAESLISIRQEIDKLVKKQSEKAEYDNLISFIENVAGRLKGIIGAYNERDTLYVEILKSIRFLDEKLEKLKNDKNTILNNIEIEENTLRTNSINKDGLEILKIQNEIKANSDLLDTQNNIIENLSGELNKQKLNLVTKKLENTYHLMLKEISNKETLKSEIKALQLDNQELLSERNNSAVKVKNYLVAESSKISSDLAECKKNLSDTVQEIESHQEEINKANGYIFSYQRDINKMEKNISDLTQKTESSKYDVLENVAKDRASLSMLEGSVDDCKIKREELRTKKNSLENELKQLQNKSHSLEMQHVTLDNEYKNKDTEFKKANNLFEKAKKLVEFYDENSILSAYTMLKEKIEQKNDEIFALSLKIKGILEFINGLENKSLALSEDTKMVYELIAEKYSDAMYGTDFLKALSMEEKKYFVEMNSLIPYAILLENKSYSKFKVDKDILDDYFGSAVPVINRDALNNVTLFPDNIIFTSKDADFFLNEDKIAELKEEKEKEYAFLEYELAKLKNKQKEDVANFEILKKFLDTYQSSERVQTLAAELRNAKLKIKGNERDAEELTSTTKSHKSEIITASNEIQSVETEIDKINIKINMLKEYLSILENIEINNTELAKIKNNKILKEKILNHETLLLNNLKVRERELVEKEKALEKSLERIEDKIKAIDFVSTSDDEVIDSNEYLKQKGILKAAIDKLNGVSGNLESKENQIRAAEDRIEEYKGLIEQEKESGVTIETLQYVTIDFIKNSPSLIEDIRLNVKRLEGMLKEEEDKSQNIKTNISVLTDRKKGKVDSLLENYSISYIDIEAKLVNILGDSPIDDVIKELQLTNRTSKQNLKKLRSDSSKFDNDIFECEKNIDRYFLLKKNINVEVQIDNVPLESVRAAKMVDSDLDRCRNFTLGKVSEYTKYLDKGDALIVNLESFKDIFTELKDISNVTNDVKDQYYKLVGRDEEDESLIYLINLEREKLIKDIESLALQEEKFIALCIQKSENVLRDVKKLSNLSAIEIGDLKQELIKINLNKLPDEVVKERMKLYIENLIKSCDNFDESKKRVALASGLTIDKLFIQIISPIKAKSVLLYKLEDIENLDVNQWLSWNKAYGSKGQTNGMYISVLICLISYLRKLYTTSSDDSKKVIILDNPFAGTTSEIIWYPILKLLKENNVQLWAFGYEIKAQLSNCFDTRYWLKKEPTSRGESVVISDFRSNYDLDRLDFDPLKGKQMITIPEKN